MSHVLLYLQEKFVQEGMLGSGQFGVVYKFCDQSKKLYAGKTLYSGIIPGYPSLSAEQLSQFAEEIEDTSIIFTTYDHPNVEKFEAIFQLSSNNPPTLLSELLFENLDMFTTRINGECKVYKQLELCHDMAKGLQYLHSAGIIHKNLHGRNILLNENARAKIADYVSPQVLKVGEKTALADVAYLSPEAVINRSLCTEHSDVYSMGVLFLQVAVQKVPASTDNDVLSKLNKRNAELSDVKHHPLLTTILQCLNAIRLTRPSVDRICRALEAAMKSPQSLISRLGHEVSAMFKILMSQPFFYKICAFATSKLLLLTHHLANLIQYRFTHLKYHVKCVT